MIAKRLGTLLLCLCALQAHAQVNALPQARHVLVYGEAHARAIPDRFKLTLAFEEVDPGAQVARDKLQRNFQSALDQLEKAGVAEGDIVATGLEIGPHERYDDRRQQNVYDGVSASRKLTARFTGTASLEAFLAGFKASEQVQVSGVDTELSTRDALMDQLRAKAIEDTRRKAETIANAYGARLAGLYSVSDVAPQFSYGVREGNWQDGYAWDGNSQTLDRITVTGSRIPGARTESFKVGYIDFTDKIYAVFLLAD